MNWRIRGFVFSCDKQIRSCRMIAVGIGIKKNFMATDGGTSKNLEGQVAMEGLQR